MPIYEYECAACNQVTEAVQRFSDPPLTECAHCHGHLRKLISRSTFHLKGSGWYTTDYAGKNQSTSASAASSSSTEKSSNDSAKPESKSCAASSDSTT